MVYLSSACPRPWLSHSRVFHPGDRAPLPISRTIQNKVSGVPPARKSLTDRGKSVAKGKGKREGKTQNAWPPATPPTPSLNERGWRNLSLRREGGARRATLEVVSSCVSQLLTHILLPRCKKARLNQPTKNENGTGLTFLSERLQSPLTTMLPAEPGAQEPNDQQKPKRLDVCFREPPAAAHHDAPDSAVSTGSLWLKVACLFVTEY